MPGGHGLHAGSLTGPAGLRLAGQAPGSLPLSTAENPISGPLL